MNDEFSLEAALRKLAASEPHQASPEAEARLVAAFRERPRRRLVPVRWLAAAAACLLLAAGGAFTLHHRKTDSTAYANSNGFVLLPYGQSDVPLEQGVIVRVKVQSGAGPVDADLLIGQDGIARAVRFVQ